MAKRKLEVQIVGDSKSLERAFGRSSKAGSDFGRRMGDTGKKAAMGLGVGAVAAVGLGAKMVKLAGDAAEVESKFKVTFGREMPKLTKQLDEFSKATGASRFQLREQTADMGALLAPILKNTVAAGDMSVGFVKLATDLSSFNNVPVGDALLAIRSGLVGEAEPLRRFGVLLNEGAVKAEAYRAGIAKTGATLTEQQKVQARANLIMQQTTLAQRDAERTSGSFANQLRKLQNTIKDTGTELGQKLLPHVTGLLNRLNQDVIPAVTAWGATLGEKLQPKLDAAAAWARDHKDDFSDLFKDAAEKGGDFASALGKITKTADRVAKSTGGWDESFSLILSGVLASKLGKVAGKAGGLAGFLKKIKGFGPTLALTIGIDLIINKDDRKWLKDNLTGWVREELWAFGLGADPMKKRGGIGSLGTLGTGEKNALTPTGVGGLAIPTSFRSTHQTDGLGGFPAVDLFAKPGTKVLAPENGTLTRTSGADPSVTPAAFKGYSLYYVGNETGNTYFITHLATVAPLGAYRRGDVIATIAAGTAGGAHAHVGIHSGASGGAYMPSTSTPPHPDGTTSGRGRGGSGGGTPAPDYGPSTPSTTAKKLKDSPLIPAFLREAMSKAEGTKITTDDTKALDQIVTYLRKKLAATKDAEKRIEIRDTLNDTLARIAAIRADEKDKTKKIDIARHVAWEKLQEKMKSQFKLALDRAREAVSSARDAYGTAFGKVADKAMQIFDAKTARLLAGARAKVTAFGFEIGAGEDTPTEKLLKERRAARDKADRQARLAAAETAEERNQILAEIEDARLEEQAQAERKAADEALAAERTRIEQERAVKREGFEKDLADLQAQWTKTNATADQRTAELKALLEKYGVPFADVGELVGQAFADGFMSALAELFAKLDELESRLRNAESITEDGYSKFATDRKRNASKSANLLLPTFADGVQNFQGGMAIVGERGPEVVSLPRGSSVYPNGSPMGTTIIVNVAGSVTSERGLIDAIHTGLLQKKRRTGTLGFA